MNTAHANSMTITCSDSPADVSLGYAQLLAQLIRIDTVRDVEHSVDESANDRFFSKIKTFRATLETMFPHLFATCTYEDFGDAFLLRWSGTNPDAAPVLFMNHHDVVGANGTWTSHDPFSGDIADGRVWGRGALDTKGGLFCMLQAAEELIADGFQPACDIYFESSCDEETDGSGCDAISQALLERGVRLRLCLDEGGYIVHDPLGGADGDFAMVGVGEKSFVSLKFTAAGSGGHASFPGKNTPLVRLAKFVTAAERAADAGTLFPLELSPCIAEMMRRMAPTMKGPLGKAFANPGKLKPLLERLMPVASDKAASLLRTTAAFTMAQGSEAYNVLPSEAWVVANLRCSHHQGKEASVKAITKLAKRYKLDVEVLEESVESPLSNFDCPEFRALERCIQKHFPGVIVSPYVMAGASDARFMGRICDTCYRFVPFQIDEQQFDSIHGIDENVYISMLEPGIRVYQDLMREMQS